MRYLLVLLTHGADGRFLEAAAASLREHVTPAPTDVYYHADGAAAGARCESLGDLFGVREWLGYVQQEQAGFCTATRRAWHDAVTLSKYPYVLWLEHDFVFTRPLDLRPLARVLDEHPQLAQMQLMRNAVNEQERAAGGLYESRPEQYLKRCEPLGSFGEPPIWMEQTAYMTTNPCLMRRDFMAEHPWPGYDDQCEGRFGIDLVRAGYSFGVWGAGEPWVEHVGVRDGFGY